MLNPATDKTSLAHDFSDSQNKESRKLRVSNYIQLKHGFDT